MTHGDVIGSGVRAYGLWWSDGRSKWSITAGLDDPRDTIELVRSMMCSAPAAAESRLRVSSHHEDGSVR